MDTQSIFTTRQLSFTLFSALLLGYVTLCGTLWHLGYWSTFGFNFLEYVRLTDLFKSTIYPFFSRSWLLLTIFLVSFGMSYGMIIMTKLKQQQTSIIPPYTLFDYSKYSKELMILDVLILGSISIGGLWILAIGPRALTIAVPILFAGLGFILIRLKFLRDYFKDDLLRSLFILGVTLFAGFNFSIAKRSATEAISFYKYRRINDIKTDNANLDSMILHRPYLGATSEFSFVLINSSNIMILNNSRIQYVIIEDYIAPINQHIKRK